MHKSYAQVFILLVLWCCLLSTSVLADPRHQDPVMEAELDHYLIEHPPSYEDAVEILQDIRDRQSPNTPVMTQVRTLTYLAIDRWLMGQQEQGWDTVREGLRIAERSGVADAVAEATAASITLHFYEGEVQQALVELERLQRALADTSNPRILYFGHNLAGRLLQSASDYEGALTHFLAAAEAVPHTREELRGGRRYLLTRAIAYLQSNLRHYDTALEYADRAIEIALQQGFDYAMGDLYLLKGYLLSHLERYEESIAVHEQAVDWARTSQDIDILLLSMNNIGSTYIHQKQYEQARAILTEALDEANAYEIEYVAWLLRFNLAYVDVFTGQVEEGVARLETATEQLKEQYTDAEYADLLEYVADAYAEAKLWEKAVAALLEQRTLNEEVARSQREEALNELQTRYQANEQAAQIELLEQANQLQQQLIENAALQKRIFILFVVVVILASILLLIALASIKRANAKLKNVNKQLKHQSTHDPLTELLNRRSFQEEMKTRAKTLNQRQPQRFPDALLLLDVDYFKQINDQHGHAAGDLVLVELSKRLKRISRTSDMVIRWGGEEFLIYLKEMDPDHLAEYTERVLEVIAEQPVKLNDKQVSVSVTAGFISLPFAGISESVLGWERCLQIADMALYIGKVQGRNRGLGVIGLQVPFEEAEVALSKDLGGAIEKGWVRTAQVYGPDLED